MKEKAPAVQWYFGDWLKCAEVRLCSAEARGVWMDMLAFMHQAEPYGHLIFNGKPVTAIKLANMVGGGMTVARVSILLKELGDNGVYSTDDKGVIFCRRMVRDHLKREAWRLEKEAQRVQKEAKSAAGQSTDKAPDKSRTKHRTNDGQTTDKAPDNPPMSGDVSANCPPDLQSSVFSLHSSNPEKHSSDSSNIPQDSERVAALRSILDRERVESAGMKATLHLRQFELDGLSDQHLADAIALAREKKPHPEIIPIRYLATLLPDVVAGIARASEPRGKDAVAEAVRRISAKEAARESR